MINSKEFAKAMHEALERDDWGDIDPIWFRIIAEGAEDGYDEDDIYTAWRLENIISEVIEEIDLSKD
jgi:hypothetical protein